MGYRVQTTLTCCISMNILKITLKTMGYTKITLKTIGVTLRYDKHEHFENYTKNYGGI